MAVLCATSPKGEATEDPHSLQSQNNSYDESDSTSMLLDHAGTKLPPDCWTAVVSFLSLRDCFRFGSVSLSAFRDIQQDLMQRRKRLTTVFYYEESYHLVDHHHLSHCENRLEPCRLWTKEQKGARCVHALPTVLERVESLQKILSCLHPLAKCVRELILEIRNYSDDNEDEDETETTTTTTFHFETVFHQHVKHMKAHKYHAHILSSATTRSEFKSPGCHAYDSERNRNVSNNQVNVLTVTLQRYMGDVYCAFYLMGHGAAGIMEGCPSERAWMECILSDIQKIGRGECDDQSRLHLSVLPKRTENENQQQQQPQPPVPLMFAPLACYRAWVFLHSTVLRTAPFTWNQLCRLGIACLGSSGSLTKNHATATMDDDVLIPPFGPFTGIDKKPAMERFLRYSVASSMTGLNLPPLRVTLQSFGYLGPMYRGRDLIRSQTIFASSPIGVIVGFDGMPATRYSTSNQPTRTAATRMRNNNPFFEGWRTGSDDCVGWLLTLHEQVRKTRPMTVEPHLVTINCQL